MKQPCAIVLALVLSASQAFAQNFEAAVIARLQAEGYVQITTTTTILGRVRIVALGSNGQREIVLNPRTGETLRDVWLVTDPSAAPQSSGATRPLADGVRSDSDDDDSADDRDDDSDEDQNSGSNGGSDDRGGNDDDDSKEDDDDDDDNDKDNDDD